MSGVRDRKSGQDEDGGTPWTETSKSTTVRLPKIKEKPLNFENPEIANLLYDQTRVPKVRPMPNFRDIKIDPFADSPLLKFHIAGAQKRRKFEIIEKKTRMRKIQVFKECRRPMEHDEPQLLNSQHYHTLMLQYAAKVPTTSITDKWIESIRNRLQGLDKKFPKVAKALFEEISDEFNSEMSKFGLHCTVKEFMEPDSVLPSERCPIVIRRTERYGNFLKSRMRLKRHLHIFHPIQATIFALGMTNLPELSVDLNKYREQGFLNLMDFNEMVSSDIKNGEHVVVTKYYMKIVSLIDKKNALSGISDKLKAEFLDSATNVFSIQVLKFIHRSIEHLLLCLSDELKMPHLSLNISCNEKGICLKPDRDEVEQIFHSILEEMSDVSASLLSLHTWVDGVPAKTPQIKIQVNETFMKESHIKIKKCLDYTMKDVIKYVEALNKEHGFLIRRKIFKELDAFMVTNPTFEELVDKRKMFQKYVDRLGAIVANEYFIMGRLTQSDLIVELNKLAKEYSEKIMENLIKTHVRENHSICEKFEELKARALKVPESTEELMESGVYMLWASTSYMVTLEASIRSQLENMVTLIELTEVPKSTISLMARTLAWVQNMQPVFDQNSSQYEQFKFEFEERLQKRIESLHNSINELEPKLEILNDMDDPQKIPEYLEEMERFLRILKSLESDVEWINHEESLFKFPLSTYPDLDEIKAFIEPFGKLLTLAHRWQWKYRVWMNGSFQNLDAAVVENSTEDFYEEFLNAQKTYKSKIKQQIQENVSRRFKGNVDDPDPNNWPTPIKICNKMLEEISSFKSHVPLVRILCNSALMQRHWDEMSLICQFDITPDYGTTLRKVAAKNLGPYLDQFEIISVGATKELQLREDLRKMWSEWEGIIFTSRMWKDTNLFILCECDDIQALLDDHLVKTQNMRGSAFVKPFESEVKNWYLLLDRVIKTKDTWEKVQAQWLYLMPIFSSKDITVQMPEENRLFKDVDNFYQRVMQGVVKDPRVLETAGTTGLLESFLEQLDNLDTIKSGVNNYLEKKRLYFPRFFFLSNDEMLEILSQTNDPYRVQPHLKKCFEGINRLKLDSNLKIESMISSEGELINFVSQIDVQAAGESVEKWLVQVEEQMIISIHDVIRKAHAAFVTTPRNNWIQTWPGQIVICVSSIYWTLQVHRELKRGDYTSLQNFHQVLSEQLNSVALIVRGHLSALARLILGTLIITEVHARDVVQELYKVQVKSDRDFSWLAQLRYYWQDGKCLVRMINATLKYAYEYLGNTPRLVITPLTDRCFRTLIGAYSLHLNGAPKGPDGTGKTETIRDLAKALAIHCIVFNCSDGLDYITMGKFFKGLASSGAWACFDEFNRIKLEVLSVVAQQILSIARAVQANMEIFFFEGVKIKLNPACYVCITTNPELIGHSELPDNLKVLFRTVAMMVPDCILIGEVSLYSYGFVNARELSVKIVTIYRLCHEQLSTQSHYDYGMRAVKTVLTAARNIRLSYPDVDENVILLRAIVDVTRPKLLDRDIPLFDDIISDTFPGVIPIKPTYGLLLKAVDLVFEKNNLQPTKYLQQKLIETYEMMKIRHGFMLVGETFSGKTTVLRVLADVLCQMSDPTVYQTINPKSITMDQLYGSFDPVNYEWLDGVLAVAFRTFVWGEKGVRKWIIFDGPVDAIWIENLNTVLDDNKKFCLTSGEVIALTTEMNLIFETADLKQASPAIVSRCGVIYLEPAALDWQVLVRSWINSQNPIWMEGNREMIMDLFLWLIPVSLNFIQRNCEVLIQISDLEKVHTMLVIIKMLMEDACQTTEILFVPIWIQAAFVFAGTWGLGGVLNSYSRTIFSDFYLDLWRGVNNDYLIPESLGKVEISIPSEGVLNDYLYNFRGKGHWRYLPEVLKQEKVEEMVYLPQTLVPTVDTLRYSYIMNLHIQQKVPLLLIGETGTGKSFMIRNILTTKIDQELYLPSFISFTTATSANLAQKLVMSKLNRLRRGKFGPPKGKHSIIHIDDINMAAKDTYGTQPAIELLRQILDAGLWYDLKDSSTIKLEDVQFVASMGLPGGGRQKVTSRLLRNFNVFSINSLPEESITRIFSTILFYGLRRNGFATDVTASVNNLVNATTNIYLSSLEELRPTPNKPHYMFNLRDYSRVIMGCSLAKKDFTESRKQFARLWVHEALRVFYDRLVTNEDKEWMFQKIRQCVKEDIKEDFDQLQSDNEVCSQETLRTLMFGSYLDTEALPEDRKYEELSSVNQLLEIAKMAMYEYNKSHKIKINVVFFRDALEHLNRICRILATPQGSGLLVGVSGAGRESLCRLATAMLNYEFFQPEITSNYSLNEWQNDLKKVLKESGGRGRNVSFFIAEGEIREESFLADIDTLLNLGEIPELFNYDEKQEILEMVRLAAQGGNRNLDITPLAVLNFFINRCKLKLHLLICLSSVGSNFRNRIRSYPSLANCCTIDWFEEWPSEALQMVATEFVESANLEQNIKEAVVIACQHYHTSACAISDEFFAKTSRKTYITSNAFLSLVSSFTRLVNKTQESIKTSKMRYVSGLDKLNFAAEQFATMSKELSDLKPKLVVAAKETLEMMKVIESEKKKVEAITLLVKEDEKVANEQAAAAAELKAECEADLAQAIPILEDAIAALNTLKPADITLVKSMKNPPQTVKLVMAAVCVMKNIQPDKLPDQVTGRKILDYWGPSKRILGDMNFLQTLKDYDKDNINPEIMYKIRKEYIPLDDFKPSAVAKASSAAEGLCKWVIAMDLYDAVSKEVAPKKLKLENAEKEFSETMVLLSAKRQMVEQLEAQLAELMQNLRDTQERKQKLENDVIMCENKLFRAEKLINGLGGEKSRWLAAAEELQENYNSVAGDVLISCGVIAYLAPFTSPFRVQIIAQWHNYCRELGIPCSKTYQFAKVLGSEVVIQNWNICGLPCDQFSIDNAIIMDASEQWSLFVDPQRQVNKWIRVMEKSNNLEVVKLSTPGYIKIIEYCIEYGKPVLIESVMETLDAVLDPILLKKVFIQDGKKFINLRDEILEYNDNFKLYLTTDLRNPHYMPEVFSKVRIINFALTMEGLEDQLLGIVVAKERPDLQAKRQGLIVRNAKNKKGLLDVEELILQTLSESKGNILEDETAIETLDSSRLLSESIKSEQASAKETERVIESFRMSYRSIAAHSSILYYCITNLITVNPMYQYSLTWYINLFISSIDSANKSKILEKRLQFLNETFTYDLYSNVCRSIFEKDKLLFSLVLCCAILIHKNKIERSEYHFLITEGLKPSKAVSPNPVDSEWFPDSSWCELERVSAFPAFQGILEDFSGNATNWTKFYDLPDPTLDDIPAPWNKQLSLFQRLMLIRIFRPDKVHSNVFNFISTEMGEKFVRPPSFDLAKCYLESNCFSPLIFILSPGSDPMADLLAFVEKMGYSDKFESISLGQGQGLLAEQLIEDAQKEGKWVCLQNCHLAAAWMQRLEEINERMDNMNTTLEFRLWLTSHPSIDFPGRILQNGVKITNEAPLGLKANILRSFQSHPINNPEFFEGLPGKNTIFGKLLYGMTFFHALIQERKMFGPIGWNIPYEFDESDFQISIKQLVAFLQDYPQVPYEAVTYLAGECNYGGRVTDSWDRRCLNTILMDFINPKIVSKPDYLFVPVGLSYYGLPRKVGYRDYLDHIEKMPQNPPPEVFGLHNNAGIKQGQQFMKDLFNNAMLMEGIESRVDGMSYQTLSDVVTNILYYLPEKFNLESAIEKYPVMYSESRNAFLIQELGRFNILLSTLQETLDTLLKAIRGLVIMTSDVETLANSLRLNQVPMAWIKIGYPSLKKLGSYIIDLHKRITMFNLWLKEGIPEKFWIAGFFSVHGFLSVVMQNYARKYSIAFDKLTYDFAIIPDNLEKPEDGVHVFGLFIEGARWDGELKHLVEQRPKILFQPLPNLLWIIPIKKADLKYRGRYACPLYRTSERRGTLSTTGNSTNFVLSVLLESNINVSHWIKRGVALLCQLDD